MGEILELVVEYDPQQRIDYNHHFGIGTEEMIDGKKKIFPWLTFEGRKNIVNAYGWWQDVLGYVGHKALAFRIIKGRFCEVRDDIAKEGLLQYRRRVKNSVSVN